MFLISNTICSLLVRRKMIDFCIFTYTLQPCYDHLQVSRFFIQFFQAFYKTIMPSAEIISSFIICMPSYFFLVALGRSSSVIFKRSGKKGHPCLVPDTYWESIWFLTIKRDIRCSFFFLWEVFVMNVEFRQILILIWSYDFSF